MDIFALLQDRFPRIRKERNFSFAAHTTIGCGGTAAVAVSPDSAEEVRETLVYLKKEGIPFCFLGAGANVLPSDGFWDGVVIRFCNLRSLRAEDSLIAAGAGVTGGELLRFAAARSLGGFEPFAGIPMTVGGGTAMNAGIRDRHFSDLVASVTGVADGEIRKFNANECEYSEKSSIFLQGIAITEVCFKTVSSDCIAANTERYLKARQKLPKGRSMGCTFVNPEGKSAGAIIDQCGLKGRSCGKARVSEIHANFIINEGCSSHNVSELISIVKEEVRQKTGILLREEIRRIP